ncbi:MAG TPA: hypothetical protein VM286_08775 [Candidatus Thermoplasmatota archaeon]|nr:hypothetical protein [Candidatus Thermoplasmatota archaeon]
MRFFDLRGARAFGRGFGRSAITPNVSMKAFLGQTAGASWTEGSPAFDGYRDCLLREADRRLLLAVTNFRRSHDLLTPASAAWAQVTLYYSSFFAASSIAAMFGCWVDAPNELVDVARSKAGAQEVSVLRSESQIRRLANNARGTHKPFWFLFYAGASTVTPLLPTSLSNALTPISGQRDWLISARNKVNYQTPEAMVAANDFHASFSAAMYPTGLVGDLGTQHQAAADLVAAAAWLSRKVRLKTDALNMVAPANARRANLVAALRAPARVATRGMASRLNI